jgi:hypothetical protein
MKYGDFLKLTEKQKREVYDKLEPETRNELFESWKKTAIAVSRDFTNFFQAHYKADFDTVNTK